MQITLFSSFSKEANSTKQPSGGTAVSCFLKDNTSIIHPVFILDRTDFSINYVQWGSRYYFVDDIVSIRNTTIEVHCTVDPMATYKTAIGASSQYVTRSASAYDEYIIDGLYPATVHTQFEKFTLDLGLSNQSGTFIVGMVNKNSTASGGITYYLMTADMFAQFLAFLYGGSWLDAPLTELSLQLQKELVNPFQYIVSCMYIPYDCFGVSQTFENYMFGYWEDTMHASEIITPASRYLNLIASATVPRHPQNSIRGAYMNSNPFTRMTLLCYGFGTIPLDPQNFIDNDRLTLQLTVDKCTGTGQLRISNTGDDNAILQLSGQIGVPMQISQITQNMTGFGLSSVASVLSAVSMNPMGIASGLISATQALMPQMQTQGSVGSGVFYNFIPQVTMQYKLLTTYDTEHLGRPLMQRRTINTLSGFIQVENPDVDIVGTTYEKDLIASYMRSGFYYE